MNCSQCNQPLNDGALYCESCGYQHAILEQRAKVAAVKSQIRGAISAKFGSALFLIMTICFTAMTVTQLAAMVVAMFSCGSLMSGILPAVFLIITDVAMWKCFIKSKKGAIDASAIKDVSMYDAYSRVCLTISIVVYIIFGVIGAILIFRGTSAIGAAAGEKEAATMGGIIGVIIFLVFIGAVVAVTSCFRKIYVNRRRFFTELSHTAISGEYRVKKVPVAGSWVLGILMAITVISTVSLSALLDSGVEMLYGLIGDLGETAETKELIDMIDEFVDGLATTLVISAISSVVTAAYYICCAIWMSGVHKAQIDNASLIIDEAKSLAAIEIATRQAIIQRNNEKRQEEAAKFKAEEEARLAIEVEKRAAELETQRAQNEIDEQQKMLELMQQMIAQNPGKFADLMNTAATSANREEAASAQAPEADQAKEVPAEE